MRGLVTQKGVEEDFDLAQEKRTLLLRAGGLESVLAGTQGRPSTP